MVNINVDKMKLLYPSREEVKTMPTFKCLKRFETEELLARHSIRHETEFSCQYCGMRFQENRQVEFHIEESHF